MAGHTTFAIAARVWNLCHVLKDVGGTSHQYFSELTYRQYLKLGSATNSSAPLVQEMHANALLHQEARHAQHAGAGDRQAG